MSQHGGVPAAGAPPPNQTSSDLLAKKTPQPANGKFGLTPTRGCQGAAATSAPNLNAFGWHSKKAL